MHITLIPSVSVSCYKGFASNMRLAGGWEKERGNHARGWSLRDRAFGGMVMD